MVKGLTKKVAMKMIEESHPQPEVKKCINKIQQKTKCRICEAACPENILDDLEKVDFSRCDDCGICVAHCPTDTFTGSPFYVEKLLDLVGKTDQRVTLSCRKNEEEADCKLGCLASYPWEVIAILALRGNQVFFHRKNCEECELKEKMIFFDRMMERIKDFLDEKTYRSFIGEIPFSRLHNRRQALEELLKRSRHGLSAMIPEEYGKKADSKLWKKILRFQLMHPLEEKKQDEYGWYTPVITEKCRACGICTKVCPNEAIHVVPIDSGEFYMAHFTWKCGGCGLCEVVCPFQGINGFGVVKEKKVEEPILTLTGAKACRQCKEPCYEDELCISCKVKQRGN